MRRLPLLLLVVAPLLAFPARAEPVLGTLLFSPEERVALARARNGETTEEKEAARNVRVTLNGVVRRANGKSTVWINGEAVTEGEPSHPSLPTPTVRAAHTVALDGKVIRVGETLDLVSGERKDFIGADALTVKARP